MAVDEKLREFATDRQWEIYMAVHNLGTKRATSRALNIAERNVYDAISSIYKKAEKANYTPQERNIKRYVVTSAQNNTSVCKKFFASLLQYCEHASAELIVIPVNYENITLTQKNGKDERWWSADLVPYLCNTRRQLNENLLLMGDVSVNATNVNPLSGMQTVTGKCSGIFGHGQIEMEVVPTPESKLPKMLHTTGSVTERNYSDSKAGKIADDNHCIGALMVEADEDHFWMRELRSDEDGSFYDLDCKVMPTGIEKSDSVPGLVCGDIHWDFICPMVKSATFTDDDSIVNTLNPEQIVLHDVLDFYSGSHHHERDPLLKFYKHHNQKNSVEGELRRLVEGIQEITRPDDHLLFVGSNHNEHLSRWLNECDPKRDPENALIYHRLRLIQLENAKESREFLNPLEWYFQQNMPDRKFEFIQRDEGRLIGRYDISNHGDIGANGSRGTARQFTRFGGHYILGHSHTPGIRKNVIQVGTSSILNLEYNIGPSSWLNSHAVIYPNGLASLVHIINGRWRA